MALIKVEQSMSNAERCLWSACGLAVIILMLWPVA